MRENPSRMRASPQSYTAVNKKLSSSSSEITAAALIKRNGNSEFYEWGLLLFRLQSRRSKRKLLGTHKGMSCAGMPACAFGQAVFVGTPPPPFQPCVTPRNGVTKREFVEWPKVSVQSNLSLSQWVNWSACLWDGAKSHHSENIICLRRPFSRSLVEPYGEWDRPLFWA